MHEITWLPMMLSYKQNNLYFCVVGDGTQVLWLGQSELSTTWENAEVLPAAVIQEYEDGMESEAVEECMKEYGMERSTFVAKPPSPREQAKRARNERPVLEQTTG